MRHLLLVVIALLSWSAFADDPTTGFSVEGAVKTPLHLTVADLKQMSGIQVDAAFEAKGKTDKASYVGVSLIDLINKAGVVDGAAKGAHLRHVIEVSGRDGYTVAVAMGEIAPKLEGKPVMIAYLRDGKPVETGNTVRLIVPGDHHGARNVHDVARIEVK
jgi:DMSO/TMAO reductase YedYZ molybdopterin-dependent catalytic subunit